MLLWLGISLSLLTACVLAAILSWIFRSCAWAASAHSEQVPLQVGNMEDEIKAMVERLKAIQPDIEHIMTLAGTVGCSLGAIHHGRIIHTAHFGYRDLAQKTQPNDDTIYPVCSLSKSMTAATVGILVDEGAFTWDTKIIDVLEDFRIEDDTMRMNATLVDLLSHRSGLQGTNMWLGSQNDVLFPASDAMNVINSLKLAHPFRAAWEYSNYGYELVAQVIFKTLGSKWYEVVADRILGPLDLKRTGFNADFGHHDNVALAYATLDDASPVQIQGPKLSSETILGAGGGVRSSIRDMLEFYRVLLVSGSDQQKSGKTSTPDSSFRQVREQFSPHIQLSGPKYSQTSYGFGLARVQLPGPMGAIGTNPALYPDMPIVGRGSPTRLALYHQGTLAGAFATVILFPETDSGVVVLTNSLPLNDSDDWIGQLMTETMFDIKDRNDYVALAQKSADSQRTWHDRLQDQLRQKYPLKVDPRPLSDYVGKYYSKAGTLLIHITEDNGTLFMNFQDHPQETYKMAHCQGDVFTWLSSRNDLARRGRFTRFGAWFYTMTFAANADGEIVSVNWQHDEAKKEGEDFFRR